MGSSLPRTAYLLADTPIPDDPRVRRQGDLLHAAGWKVIGIGMGGWRSPEPEWEVLTPPSEPNGAAADLMLKPGSAARENLKSVWRVFAHLGAMLAAPIPALVGVAWPKAAKALESERRSLRGDTTWPVARMRRLRLWVKRAPYWARLYAGDESVVEDHFLFRATPHLRQLSDIAQRFAEPGVWVANDWRMLPIAARAAQASGGRFVYDSHEFATEEYAERLSWRLFQKPVAATIEKQWIKDAAAVVSVSPGITEALRTLYGLTCPLDSIRNTPRYASTPFHATGSVIRLLYHGVVAQGRGLKESIEAMALLPEEFDLSIRGPSSPRGYADELVQLIRDLKLESRVRLLPPAPMSDLVREAAAFDVGMMALPGHSAHNQLALPNKVFEYMMAGLSLCVSGLPSMKELVETTGAGVTFSGTDPTSIAAALKDLSAERIDTFKRAALEAAKVYNWDQEGGRFLALLENARAPVG